MTVRIKLGSLLSVGRSGPRLHVGPSWLRASVGARDARAYVKAGPLYSVFGKRWGR